MQRKSWVPYLALAATDAVLAGVKDERARRSRRLTKPLLMPTLALTAQPTPALATAGLGLSTVGDVALLSESETAFTVGLGSFLAAHGCYVTAFVRRGGAQGLRRQPWKLLPALTLATWSALKLAPRAGQMRWPVTGYGVMIGSMAALAAGTGNPKLAWGAASFCLSDLLLATAKFTGAPEVKAFSVHQAAVMATYTTGQALIVAGLRGV